MGAWCSLSECLGSFIQQLPSLHARANSIIITVKHFMEQRGMLVVVWVHGHAHVCSQVNAKENSELLECKDL